MIKLKIVLNSKIFLIVLFFISIFRITFIKNEASILDINDNNFICTVNNINKEKILLDCGELVDTKIEDNNIKIGDILRINGYLKEYKSNSNFNLFDYKFYQNNKNIYYYLNINNYKKIGENSDFVLNIKRMIYNRITNLKSFNYLNAFILGNKASVDTDSLKQIGIIHLFSVSGMHITLLLSLFDNLVKKSKIKNKLIIIFLILYYSLIKSISLLRCIIFFLIKKINNNYNFGFSKYKEIIISIILILIIKPKSIYDIGFYYSVILSSGISIFNIKVKEKNKIKKKIFLSIFIFLLSFPLNIYTSFEVNVLSIIYNLIFIPYVSFLLFPLSLLTFLFPFLDNLLILFIDVFEYLINIFKSINLSFIFHKPSIILIIIYYLIIFLILYNYKFVYLLLIILLFHYNYNFLFPKSYVLFFDVGQGDSILIHLKKYNLLIDTGGNNNSSISKNITIPVLKSYGIRKIDYLILTHGDSDHMGEAINLVDNFDIEKVIFNCGEYNDLEKDLVKELIKNKIDYYSCIKELNINNNRLYFLQTKEYDNENDNSNVIYVEIKGFKYLFMGDSGIDKEKDILDKYNLNNIDVLKVGHHGSKTSSSKEFINEINPKYSIISVGKDNYYKHPHKEVLETLKNSKIYRTDLDGSIMFRINNNKLKIEICAP